VRDRRLGPAPQRLELAQALVPFVRAAKVVGLEPVAASPLDGGPVDEEVGAEPPVGGLRGSVLVDKVATPAQEERGRDRGSAGVGNHHKAMPGPDQVLPYALEEPLWLNGHPLPP